MQKDIDLDQVNAIDTNAKKVLEALAQFNEGEFAKGDQIQQKTGLTTETINSAVAVLEKSLLVNNPNLSDKLPPYDFYAVEISDFGRQVLEKYG